VERLLSSVFVFVLGSAIGSFLNVIRYRLPRKRDFVSGRSRCPGCGTQIAWYDNIPIASFLVLGGKCRSCGMGISWEYFITEVATGVCFVLIWLGFAPLEAVAYFVFASILIACAGIDYDFRIIPDRLTVPGMVIGVIFSVTLLRGPSAGESFLHSVIGMAVGGGTLLGVSLLYRLVRRAEGMGGGDIKLMALVGAFLGYRLALLTIFIASVGGAVVGLFLSRRSPEGMRAALPFGVFLSPAALVCLLWGEDLIKAYLALLR
jgi:leader peptidase (prepilin peptidase)/N-methyltransferase